MYEPRDIAILSYSTTKQHIYERFLKMFGIGYSCGKQKSFFYDAPINDIIAFLRVCIYQDDLLAILSYLNSPFVRLSEDSSNLVISLLAAERKEKKYFEICKRIDSELNEFIKENITIFINFTW